MVSSKRIVITVFGSLGDLHPLMAVGLGLKARGHQVTLASGELYRERVLREGLHFHPLRPRLDDTDDAVYQEVFHPTRGPEVLMKKYVLPYVAETAEDLAMALKNADFLVNSPLVFAGPLLAEKMQLPWASVALQPLIYLSPYDPPVLPIAPVTEHWRELGLWFWKPFLNFCKNTTTSWTQPVNALRREWNLPDRGNPLFEGQFSPYLNLAMFSRVFAQPQPDWPPNTHITGNAFYDRMADDDARLPDELKAFLEAGEPPVVFALGSSAVRVASDFYEVSIRAAQKLGCRALFVVGNNQPAEKLTEQQMLWPTVPYSLLFPYARAVVHQGGMGTTAQVLRAGKPMIITPFGFDQPDNAARMKRLGVSRTIHRRHYTEQAVIGELERLLADNAYTIAAQQAAQTMAGEDAVATACRLIEDCLTN